MTDERWIVVRDWERFQHRDSARTDVPPWIKLHTRLLSDEAFLDLSVGRRMLLVGIWLEYARTRRQLPDDTRSLSRRLGQRVVRRDLESLNDAGFIGFSAVKPAGSVAVKPAGLEVEVEVEDPLTPAQSAGDAGRNGDEPDRESTPEPLGTMVEAALGLAPDTTACAVCGEPVRSGYRCAACGSNPRAAGSSSRSTAKRRRGTSRFERACAYTRNEGWEYDLDAFANDLERYELTLDERREVEQLRQHLIDEDRALNW